MLKIHKNTRNLMSNMLQQQAASSSKERLFTETDSYLPSPSFLHELNQWNHSFTLHKDMLQESYQTESCPGDIQSLEGRENFMQKIRRIIEARLSDADFDVDRLSDEMKLSRVHLCQKLKCYTEHSPNELIRNFRLQRAAALLIQDGGTRYGSTISEIAFKTGFSHRSHFSKAFKKVFGVCPSQYQAYEVFRYG